MSHPVNLMLGVAFASALVIAPLSAQEYFFRKPIVGAQFDPSIGRHDDDTGETGVDEEDAGPLSITGKEYENYAFHGFTIENGTEPYTYSYIGSPPADRADQDRFFIRSDEIDCGNTHCYKRLTNNAKLGTGVDADMILVRRSVDVEPGVYYWGIQVRDATGRTAEWQTTTAFPGDPIVIATGAKSLSVGTSYDASDNIIGLSGGYGTVSVTYESEIRVPGLELVNNHLAGIPTEEGQWTLALEARDESGQVKDFDLEIDVFPDSCGLPAIFSTAGSFSYTPPEGCGTLFVEAWGGGADGKSGDRLSDDIGFGGGGGSYAASTIVNAAGTYTASVGGSGGDSAFRQSGMNIVLAVGATGSSGANGRHSVGDNTASGANSVTMNSPIPGSRPKGSGGKGAGAEGGAGGLAGERKNGENGQSPGGGGAGSEWNRTPGLGAPGMIRITPST